jgi:hypothetical protein
MQNYALQSIAVHVFHGLSVSGLSSTSTKKEIPMSKNKDSEKPKEPEETNSQVPAIGNSSDQIELPKDNRPLDEQLAECEELIHAKTDDFLDVVINLRKIKDGKLFECKYDDKQKPLYQTFEDYMDKEFGFHRAYYCRLNKAYETYKLVTDGMDEEQKEKLPKRPIVYISLNEIEKEKRKDAFNAVVKGETKQIKGADILDWGKDNKALKKRKATPKGKEQSLKIFFGLAKKLAENKTEATNKILSNFEDRDKLIESLQAIITRLTSNK